MQFLFKSPANMRNWVMISLSQVLNKSKNQRNCFACFILFGLEDYKSVAIKLHIPTPTLPPSLLPGWWLQLGVRDHQMCHHPSNDRGVRPARDIDIIKLRFSDYQIVLKSNRDLSPISPAGSVLAGLIETAQIWIFTVKSSNIII